MVSRSVQALIAVTALGLPAQARATCENLLPSRAPLDEPKRLVTPDDLLGIRDIGYPDAAAAPPDSPLAVSPDGRRIAFVIARADKTSNAYCRGLVIQDLQPGGVPRLVDTGGTFMPFVVPNRGLLINTGGGEVVTPVWSPDGSTIAYRKRIDGRTEAWIAQSDGRTGRRLARLAVDIEAVAWSEDGRRVIFASHPGYAAQAQALEREGAAGYLYDDRWQPNDDSRPALVEDTAIAAQSVDLLSGIVEPAQERDVAHLPPQYAAGLPAALAAQTARGRRAWLAPDTNLLVSPMRLHAQGANGQVIACEAEACSGSIETVHWMEGAVVYLRREGWAKGAFALYRWTPGPGAPSRLFVTEDELSGCVPANRELVCLVENSAQPRRLVRIDPDTGARHVLFDPNPQFGRLRLGSVRRLKIRNAFGLEAWADLVVPPDYRGGRLPTVVVQYYSRGFLRGGGGDEYPVHPSAAQGIAVLSIQRPALVAMRDPAATTNEALTAGGIRDWAERRSLLDVIERGLDEAVRLGVTDPDRVGITGQSDGSASSIFALINTRRFKAAAIGSCCLEPGTMMIYGGKRWARFNKAIGYPDLGTNQGTFWAPVSLGANAARIDAPLLMQVADHEYLLSLEAWARLKQARHPVEMFVYPDEYHNKWQPAHRHAVYARGLDWFAYWLAGRRDSDPAKAPQYRRWDQLEQERKAKEGTVGVAAER